MGTTSWAQSPMDRLQATVWQAGLEITARDKGRLVLCSPRAPRRVVAVTVCDGNFVWGGGNRHAASDVAGAARKIVGQLCGTNSLAS